MKIRSISISNCRSFKDKCEFIFSNGVNTIIGPNAGGKSNLLDIINIIIRAYINLNFYTNKHENLDGVFRTLEFRAPMQNSRTLLKKFEDEDHENKKQEISLVLEVEQSDVTNLNTIIEFKQQLLTHINTFRNPNGQWSQVLNLLTDSPFEVGERLVINLVDYTLQVPEEGAQGHSFFQYLKFIELFVLLFSEIDGPKLSPAFLFFSSFRAIDNSHVRANLSGSNFHELLWGYVQSTTRTNTALLPLATYSLAEKHLRLEKQAALVGFKEAWEKDVDVLLIKAYANQLGYEWGIESIEPRMNQYEIYLEKMKENCFLAKLAQVKEKYLIFFLVFAHLKLHQG